MSAISTYLDQHKDRFLDELLALLKIPSVSADPKFKEDVFEAANFLKARLLALDLDEVEICPTDGYPIVYGEKIIDEKLPTVLVYGHYDVQPADPYELWNSPPFEPTVKEGRIYARGACDDKGQVYMHLKAYEIMKETGNIACNIKFMIEGEEEVGSDNLGPFLEANKEKLKADVVLVSDTSMIGLDNPSITVGLRGLSYVEVEVTGPNIDLHSGVYGGAVANPVNVLSKMIASLHDENNYITIPGFYDDVEVLNENQRKAMAATPFNLEEYKQHLDIAEVQGEAGFTTIERTSIRPTLDVNGIWGGYIGEGAKTVLPSKAQAKISMRLVPNQNSDKITTLFQKHFEGEPVVTPTNSVAYQAAAKAIEHTFGKTPIPQRGGGSIPIVALFESILGIKTILMGFGDDSDAIHSPNEKFDLANYYKGIETIPYFYQYYAEMSVLEDRN